MNVPRTSLPMPKSKSNDASKNQVEEAVDTVSFKDLGLAAPLNKALDEVGYETPSPIQALTIPHLLQGLDVLGHAPTGTGKTAAFALPLLSRLDLKAKGVQILVLAPTRELAIQVSEAFQRYASRMKDFHILPIYGGQDYSGQIRQLRRGVHAVVGTPGRVMDHMRRGTLVLSDIKAMVLDEADEMLRMGFHEDVEWILEQMPKEKQMALFSATMPKQVLKIARKFQDDPKEITIESKTKTASTIRQRFWSVSQSHKLDALTRILEVEPFEGIIVFVRTKTATTELAEKLSARGYAAAAINGDLVQKQREKTIQGLKQGKLDILVATDVAARGLDVDRISHVINYDIPHDTESYIHRIGRTGRAGRTGEAILFVAPREKRMLSAIERATGQKIEPMKLPSTEMVNNKRISDFKQSISDVLAAGDLEFMQGVIDQYVLEHDIPAIEVAAALAKMAVADRPLLVKDIPTVVERGPSRDSRSADGAGNRGDSARRKPQKPRRRDGSVPEGMERFRISVGSNHDVKPGNIVGAIANEAGLDAEHIGHVNIMEDYSLVDLPAGMPKDVFTDLKKTWVCGQRLGITKAKAEPQQADDSDAAPARRKRPSAERSKSRASSDRKPRANTGKSGERKRKPSKPR
jgi:ATP-dependent RNA helicase DeaD